MNRAEQFMDYAGSEAIQWHAERLLKGKDGVVIIRVEKRGKSTHTKYGTLDEFTPEELGAKITVG